MMYSIRRLQASFGHQFEAEIMAGIDKDDVEKIWIAFSGNISPVPPLQMPYVIRHSETR